MIIDFSLQALLDILSISTAFMLGLLFITSKSKNKRANLFLGLFLWSLCLEVLDSFSPSIENYHFVIPQTALFTIPLLFIYITQTMNRKFHWFYLLLLLPGILNNIFPIQNYFEYLFNITILFIVLKFLKSHQIQVGNFYSDLENKTLSWIKFIIFSFLFFHLLWIVEDLVGIQNEDITRYFADFSNLLTFLMIYWIGYNGFSQSEIFTVQQFQSHQKNDTDIQISKKFVEISEIILTEKIFTDTGLTLKILSIHLNLKEKELSSIINKSTKKNFYHFINQFRIDEFKRLLSSPRAKQLSILGLAQEAGFSSKSTFYTAFKNIEGITPKEYQNRLKKSE